MSWLDRITIKLGQAAEERMQDAFFAEYDSGKRLSWE